MDIRMKVRGWDFRGAPQPATTLASRDCRGRNRSGGAFGQCSQ